MNTVGMQCDQTLILQGFYPHKDYPEKLRRVRFFDAETGNRIVLITNDFALPALTLVELYRS